MVSEVAISDDAKVKPEGPIASSHLEGVDMIKEYIFKKLLDIAYIQAKSLLKNSAIKLLTPADKIEEAIRYHLEAVENWAAEVSFKELKKAHFLTKVFIELDLFVYPRRIRQPGEIIEDIPLRRIFDQSHGHSILLGQPGAGKTTSMKYLCHLLLHDEDFYSDRFSFPILIKLREIQKENIEGEASLIIEQLYNLLELSMEFPKDTPTEEYRSKSKKLKEKLVVSMLEELKVLLILDGFDEIASKDLKGEVLNDIRNLAIHLNKSTMIVTSRSGDFVYHIDNATQYEMRPLKPEQIEKFAAKWLQNEQLASGFLEKIHTSPFADTAIRPLTLAHLCAIYARVGKIPEKPKSVYKRIIHLLLEEWDQQRSITRYSRYASFEIDQKFDFLCRLAYELTISFRATVFSEEELKRAYLHIYKDFNLVAGQVNQVVDELETHTGLFLQSGYSQYEFAHKSLQEYLTAEYLVKLPRIPASEEVLLKLPNELAIAVTISSDASEYFYELIINRLNNLELTRDYCKAFISRLLLEKPDFYKTGASLILALAVLYTIYVRQILQAGAPFADSVSVEFEALVRNILGWSVALPFLSYYDVRVTSEAEDNLLHLVRKEVFDTAIGDRLARLPKELYLRESFLSHAQEDSA